MANLLSVLVFIATRQAETGVPPLWPATAWTTAAAIGTAAVPVAVARRRRSIPGAVPGLDAALRAITLHRVARTVAALFAAQAGALLMSAAPALQRFSPPGTDATSVLWQIAPGAGVILAAAGVVIAVIPVSGITAQPVAKAAPAPETVP
jgi:hypothetical protein